MIRGDGNGDVIQDNGSATDVDTISYSTATAPGFVGTATNLTNFPPEWGERGVYRQRWKSPGADHVQGVKGVDYCEFDGSDFVFTCP